MPNGSGFYRDNPRLICMGHPDCRSACTYEPDSRILRAARQAVKAGKMTSADYRCIELDILGYPGKVIIGYAGQDPTGALAKRAKYACERAYSKIGRRLCLVCQMLWAMDKPKGPRIDADLHLKYPKDKWRTIRQNQATGSLRFRRKKGIFSLSNQDSFNAAAP